MWHKEDQNPATLHDQLTNWAWKISFIVILDASKGA